MFFRKPSRRTAPRRGVTLAVEGLETRLAPAGNVLSSFKHGVLTLTGDALDNSLVISQVAPELIQVAAAPGTTIDGWDTLSFNGVRDLNLRLGKGTDQVLFDLGPGPINVPGNLTIDYASFGGSGTKFTETINAGVNIFRVGHDLTARYAAGRVNTLLQNLTVGGDVTVTHTTGDNVFRIEGVLATDPAVFYGNVSVTNGPGADVNELVNVIIGGDVTLDNGDPRASDGLAGWTQVTSGPAYAPAWIGGSLRIRYASGDGTVSLWDVQVLGDTVVNLGSGTFTAFIGANPTASLGFTALRNLTVKGTGRDALYLGTGGKQLSVSGDLSFRAGSRLAAVWIDDVHVGGTTAVTTGRGADHVLVDTRDDDVGSKFDGAFTVNTGRGADAVAIQRGVGTPVTAFQGPVAVHLGAGDDRIDFGPIQGAVVQFAAAPPAAVLVDGGTGVNTLSLADGVSGRKPKFLHFAAP